MEQTNNALKAGAQESTQLTVGEAIQSSVNEIQKSFSALIEKGGLDIPKDYNITNAMVNAKLKLTDVVGKENQTLTACKPSSIVTALKKMVMFGEDVLMNHGYFIIRGDQLCYDEDYRGKLMRARRDCGVVSVNAQVVYTGDDFVYSVDNFGRYQLVRHNSSLANINKDNIVGAYAVVVKDDGTKQLEVMSMDMIRASWNQGATKGNSPAHKNFPDQMAKKTVISRALKIILASESGNDEELLDNGVSSAIEERDAAQNSTKHEILDAEAEEIKDEDVDQDTGEIRGQEASQENNPFSD